MVGVCAWNVRGLKVRYPTEDVIFTGTSQPRELHGCAVVHLPHDNDVFRNGRVWCDKLFITYPDNMLNEHGILRTALEICMQCAYETPHINQFNQSTDQPISQTADPSIYPSIHACTNQSALQSVAQCRWSVDFSTHSANNQPTNQLSNEPTSQPTNQSFNPVRPDTLL